MMDLPMNRAEEISERAMTMVAESRSLRERQEQQRKQVFERVQIATLRKPSIPLRIQMRLKLQ
jgi:hypothetical protein